MEPNHIAEPAYYAAPAPELLGNAGSLSPGDREQRYRPFMEKERLDHPG